MEPRQEVSAPGGRTTPTAWGAQRVHDSVVGRTRLKVRRLLRAGALARAVEQRLAQHAAIREARVNTESGSVLLVHSHELGHDALGRLLEDTVRGLGCQSRPGNRAAADGGAHTRAAAAVAEELGSGPAGLSPEEAERRLARYGPNALASVPPPSNLELLARHLLTAPVGLLGAAFALSVATGGLADAAVIAAVVAANAVIGYATEKRSDRIIRSLDNDGPQTAPVWRAGVAVDVATERIVPGDALRVTPGLIIPADARLLASRHLTVDESVLTGESMPVEKSAELVCDAQTELAERRNLVFRGTTCVGGSGTALVVASGARTEVGKLQTAVGQLSLPITPLQAELGNLGVRLAIISAAACVALLGIGLLRRGPVVELMKSAISLGVAAVPEGLPAIATATLALGVREMGRSRAAVRRLNAVEALGTVDVLCLDKTGTLTENRMVVTAIRAGRRRLDVGARGIEWRRRAYDAKADKTLRRLLEVVVLCNESTEREDGTLSGSPTENALLRAAAAGGAAPRNLRAAYPLIEVEYRSADRPFMRSVHRISDRYRLIAVKGRPDAVLARCRWAAGGGSKRALADRHRRAILAENDAWAGRALRVLGVAYAICPPDMPVSAAQLTWLGLVGMTDPVRDGLDVTLGTLQSAGIRTVMITGDQAATAYAIGKQLRLGGDEPINILESKDLQNLDERVLRALVERTHVFARVSPADKLAIVTALQKSGRIVAMTGDGVNDGPALRAAHVGIAMGGAQQDVARSVADVVLEDDQLATIVKAIAQGRTIHANIRKAIHYLVATNLSEIEIMLAATMLGLPAPLGPLQLLWLNLVTDVWPALALAQEAGEPEVMRRAPRSSTEPILGRTELLAMARESGVLAAATIASYVYGLLRHGAGPRAQSLAFTTLSLGQLLHALHCRAPGRRLLTRPPLAPNPRLRIALLALSAVQVAAVVAPPLRKLLKLGPVGPLDALLATAAAVAPLFVNEVLKPRRPATRIEPGAALQRGSSA